MIMAGLEFTGQKPFSDVYIHGLVMDEAGAKMDKSRGNIIDPIEMIDKYGADAVRFTMALLATEGQNVKLSPTRFEMGRNFNNKLWNASRFVLMNIPEGEYEFDATQLTDIKDRWIISALNSTIKKCTEALERYRYADTANILYDFVWHSFCDWYVELAKPDLASGDEPRTYLTRCILAHVLDRCLEMLHPIIPFITEEIWQMVGKVCKSRFEGDTIMQATGRNTTKTSSILKSRRHSPCSSTSRAASATRARTSASPSARPLTSSSPRLTKSDAQMITDHADYFRKMATVGEITAAVNAERPQPCASEVVGGSQVFIMLDASDAQAERDKLARRMADTDKFLASIDAKLANKNYVARAPNNVVEETKQKLAELLMQQSLISKNLAALEA